MKLIAAILLTLGLSAPVQAEEQLYVVYNTPSDHGIMMVAEKAWIVAPHVVITSPRTIEDLKGHRNGMLTLLTDKRPWAPVYFYKKNTAIWAKAYLCETELEVSADIPMEIASGAIGIAAILKQAGGWKSALETLYASAGGM